LAKVLLVQGHRLLDATDLSCHRIGRIKIHSIDYVAVVTEHLIRVCDKRGHTFRVKKEELELRVLEFVGSLEFSQQDIDTLFAAIRAAYDKRLAYYEAQIGMIDGKIADLGQQARSMAKNFATIAPSAQQYLNEELEDVDKQIKQLSLERMEMESKKPMNIDRVIARLKYFVENLDKLIVKQIDPVKKAQFFGLIFKSLPTYADLCGRNQNSPLFTGVNSLFEAIAGDNFPLVTPRRVELRLPG
jgi:archaellum component FlaC